MTHTPDLTIAQSQELHESLSYLDTLVIGLAYSLSPRTLG